MTDKKSNGSKQHPPAPGSHEVKDVHKIKGGESGPQEAGIHHSLRKPKPTS